MSPALYEGVPQSGRSPLDRVDGILIGALLLLALALLLINLGELPLRDWDEGTVAQVAKEISQAPGGSLRWLFPTLGGEPYLNKPTLVHGLMAIAFQLGGINEWTARLPGAVLTALSVPVLYLVGRDLFPQRIPALFAALVYLTWLPVARLGRLAMLDGAILCFTLAMMVCMVRSRRDVRFALGIGLGFGLLALTKGVMLALLLGAIALAFLRWDTPRLLMQPYLWLGLLLGMLPVAAWYGAQWVQYGPDFLGRNLVNQSFRRIWASVENNSGPPWYYLLEVIKYSAPWLLFLLAGLRHAWESRALGWAKLVLVWSGGYFLAISLMATKLPWYVLPLYPPLALAVGAQLSVLWQQGRRTGVKPYTQAPLSIGWSYALTGLAAVALVAGFYLLLGQANTRDVAQLVGTLAITLAIAALLAARQNPQFILVLVWGTYLALMQLMLTPHWVWELAEAYPVRPVAALIQQEVPRGATVYTSFPYQRPSLNFYSDRPVIPASIPNLRRHLRQDPQPFLLLGRAPLARLSADQPLTELGSAQGFTLVTTPSSPAPDTAAAAAR